LPAQREQSCANKAQVRRAVFVVDSNRVIKREGKEERREGAALKSSLRKKGLRLSGKEVESHSQSGRKVPTGSLHSILVARRRGFQKKTEKVLGNPPSFQ